MVAGWIDSCHRLDPLLADTGTALMLTGSHGELRHSVCLSNPTAREKDRFEASQLTLVRLLTQSERLVWGKSGDFAPWPAAHGRLHNASPDSQETASAKRHQPGGSYPGDGGYASGA
jgi:hypothetical protein